MLGICDKIVPGLLMGVLTFGHLPTVFVPAGPMPSGLPNKEKARVRQEFAEGAGVTRCLKLNLNLTTLLVPVRSMERQTRIS